LERPPHTPLERRRLNVQRDIQRRAIVDVGQNLLHHAAQRLVALDAGLRILAAQPRFGLGV
jgi:hypothetical protein